VVDDHSDTRDMLNAYLTMFGHQVRTAADGVEGLRIARRFRPDVILMDIWMPRMDGLETCLRLRRDTMIRDAAVYALSAGSTAELCGADCFDAFLMKPVELDRLAELVLHPLHKHH
jgi:CheY-like chemotaxis protein